MISNSMIGAIVKQFGRDEKRLFGQPGGQSRTDLRNLYHMYCYLMATKHRLSLRIGLLGKKSTNIAVRLTSSTDQQQSTITLESHLPSEEEINILICS